MQATWDLYLMGIMYFFAGIMHFIKPKAYMRVMPQFLPAHKTLVYLSGVAEIILGIGVLFPETRNLSILGIVAMLVVFFLVHFNMLRGGKHAAGVPLWILILRIPIQLLLIWWALVYWI
ncbi:MAG: DoxX family protein [Flavobacteriaceae bacterium]|nr:DoxX family protein [Flavobacteriaceae bacterium]